MFDAVIPTKCACLNSFARLPKSRDEHAWHYQRSRRDDGGRYFRKIGNRRRAWSTSDRAP